MTSSLRRKRQTTAARNTPARTLASLAGLGLLWAGSAAAQDYPPAATTPYPVTEPAKVLHFTKPAKRQAQQAAEIPNVPWAQAEPSVPSQTRPVTETSSAFPGWTPVTAPKSPILSQAADSVSQRIQTISFQQPTGTHDSAGTRVPGEGSQDHTIQLEAPGLEKLMGHLDSEANFFERIRQEGRERPDPQRIIFPEEPTIGRGAKVARAFPKRQMVAEPNYVCHGRLFFEEPNSERHGWDLGILQPVVSVGEFYLDVALLPYHFWTDPCRRYDSSAGKCLPGDPVPYMIYPPELSLTGGVMEAGIGVALFAIFP